MGYQFQLTHALHVEEKLDLDNRLCSAVTVTDGNTGRVVQALLRRTTVLQ